MTTTECDKSLSDNDFESSKPNTDSKQPYLKKRAYYTPIDESCQWQSTSVRGKALMQ